MYDCSICFATTNSGCDLYVKLLTLHQCFCDTQTNQINQLKITCPALLTHHQKKPCWWNHHCFQKNPQRVMFQHVLLRKSQRNATKKTRIWLVVLTHLKNMSQNGNLPQIGVKITNIWNHHLGIKSSFNLFMHQTSSMFIIILDGHPQILQAPLGCKAQLGGCLTRHLLARLYLICPRNLRLHRLRKFPEHKSLI